MLTPEEKAEIRLLGRKKASKMTAALWKTSIKRKRSEALNDRFKQLCHAATYEALDELMNTGLLSKDAMLQFASGMIAFVLEYQDAWEKR